jgi:hypothetical protein
MFADTRVQSMDGRHIFKYVVPAGLGAAPEWSPVTAPDAPQQHHPNEQVKTGMHDPKVWRSCDFVRSPDDSSMHLCTVHISPYSEVPDDISFSTEAVGQDTCKILQLPVEVAKVPPAEQRSGLARTSDMQNECRIVSMLPQHSPVPTTEADSLGITNFFISESPETVYCSVRGPQIRAGSEERGPGSAVAPAPEGGAVVNGSKHGAARHELYVYVKPFGKPLPQKTWPGTIWDYTPIVCISVALLLGAIALLLFSSGVFS